MPKAPIHLLYWKHDEETIEAFHSQAALAARVNEYVFDLLDGELTKAELLDMDLVEIHGLLQGANKWLPEAKKLSYHWEIDAPIQR